MSKKWGIIPAHLESTRLPRKLLRPLCGHPLIAWVYRRARRARSLDELLVATDSGEILDVCRSYRIPAVMTSTEHRCGTDRLFEVVDRGLLGSGHRDPRDVYVNIQGDEPMITADHVNLLLSPFERNSSEEGPAQSREDRELVQVTTLKVGISLEEARNPNNVKVVTDRNGRSLYFSRAMVPCDRDGTGRVQYYKHLGLYAYTASALERFHSLPPSPLEMAEKLEQLRFLENGIPAIVVEAPTDTIGVDTEEDLKKVEEYFERYRVRLPEG